MAKKYDLIAFLMALAQYLDGQGLSHNAKRTRQAARRLKKLEK